MRRLATFGLLVAVGCGAEGAARDSVLPWLAVAGGRVVERDTGRSVRLRGVNMDQFVGAATAPLADLYRHEPLWQAFTEALAE